MTMTNQMLLAAIQPDEQIYFITSKVDGLDGVVVRREEVVHVPFWTYISNNAGAVTRLKGNDFLDVLWDGGQAIKSDEWNEKFINRTNPFTKDDLKSVANLLLDVPKERKQEVQQDLSEFEKKSLDEGVSFKAPRSPLKMEPYDPDARDGDNDGIVQENTPWERPAATRLMDAAGKLIERGKESSSRPSGIRVVDADGNDVDYTPTYERSRAGTIGAGRQLGGSTSKPKKPEPKKPVVDKPTQEKPEVKPKKPGSGSALSDHGSGSLKERGLRDVRAAAAPPPPEPKKPEPEKPDASKPDVPEVPESKTIAIPAGVSGGGMRAKSFYYGDEEWEVFDEFDPVDAADAAYSIWAGYDGNFQMRHVSAALMGKETPAAYGDEVGNPQVHEIIKTGKWEEQPEWAKESAKEVILQTTHLMDAVVNGQPTERPAYRGLSDVPRDSAIFSYKPGDTFTMPLSAFTPEKGLADQFAQQSLGGPKGKSVMLVIEPGANAYRAPDGFETQFEENGEWVTDSVEYVTNGDFEVLRVENARGQTVVVLRHLQAYNSSGSRFLVKVDSESNKQIPTWVWTLFGGSMAKPAKPKVVDGRSGGNRKRKGSDAK